MAGRTGTSVSEETVLMPAYRVGPADRNPIFFSGRSYQGAKGPIYPYPMLDGLSDASEETEYKSVRLENEYVSLSVLPEIGGRIFSAVDKTNGYDFFYRQSVVKPALIGAAGAWISGGVEWNVPHHHRTSTFMPVDYRMVENEDGSSTVWVGETELRHRMKWLVGVTLHPGRSYVEVTVKLFNRTPLAHSFLYFTNAAVHVNPSYQVVFPPDVEYGTQHAKSEFIGWPLADTVYAGVDYSAGVDVSWWKNHPQWLSIFAFDSKEDFFGGYDHEREAGVVHVADHNVFPGKKFFTFAGGPGGVMWDSILTDTDGPYLELMAGAYSDNQPDYSWIQPYETRTVTEYWYPVRGLGTFKNATLDAAVNLEVVDGRAARFAFNATGRFEGATALLRAGGRTVFEKRLSIGPGEPFSGEAALPDGVRPEEVEACLYSATGEMLVSYRPRRRPGAPMPKPVEPPAPPAEIATNEELYLAGLRLEQFHNPALEPYPYYEEALRRDAGDYRVNVALGILYCKRGMFKEAADRLRSAVDRATENYTRPKDTEALYYLGVALRAAGERRQARDAFGRAAWGYAWRAGSHYQLAEMSLAEGDLESAMGSVEHSLSCNATSASALNLKATILRLMGRFDEALKVASSAVELDCLNFRSLRERVLSLSAMGAAGEARRESDVLARLMRQSVESYIELGWEYGNCGLWDEAADVLRALMEQGISDNAATTMLHYTFGYFLERGGDAEAAGGQYDLASAGNADYAFPFRLESIETLEAALRHNPTDAVARYCLGNLLYDLQPEKALEHWEMAVELDGGFATACRNLALAYARVRGDNARATAAMEAAVKCDATDARLLMELDELYEAGNTPLEKRLAMLESNHVALSRRDDALLREVVLHVLLGGHDRAIELLEGRHFHIWEGGENSAHDVYVNAHLLRGRRRLEQGLHKEALEDFAAASLYPEQFELGKPYGGGRLPEVAYFTGLAKEALGDKDGASACFESAIEGDKTGTALAYYQGLSAVKLGLDEKAAALFDGLVATGEEMLAGGREADFFGKFGFSQSISAFEAHAHYLKGLGLSGRGDREGALRAFEKALELNVSHLGARTMLEGPGSGRYQP